MKELKIYCNERKIKESAIDEFKAEGAKTANQILKKIEEANHLLDRIESLIREAETMRNAYFFTSPRIANMRRRYEKQHSVDKFEWVDGKDTYTAAFDVSCSCAHVYANGYYEKNGKKTTLKAIKSSYSRLKSRLYECE